MRNWIETESETRKISFLLFPRFSNHCLANAVEPLRAANEMAGRDVYSWEYLTLDGQTVTSSSGLPVSPNQALSDLSSGYALFVLPSYDVQSLCTVAAKRALRVATKAYDLIVGLDTGSWILAYAGLLEGRKATIHLAEITAFEERFVTTDVVRDRVVRDGKMLTCGGAMSTFDLVIDLIGEHLGEARRLEVAAFFLHQGAAGQFVEGSRLCSSDLVDRAVALMRGNIETPLSIREIASELGTYQRRLADEFGKALGASPRKVYRRTRLLAAKRYAESGAYSVAETAIRCGYQNAAALTRAFVEEFGYPPSKARAMSVRQL